MLNLIINLKGLVKLLRLKHDIFRYQKIYSKHIEGLKNRKLGFSRRIIGSQ